MLATKFKWQDEKEGGDPPWTYDGGSAMRREPAAAVSRRRRARVRRVVFLLVLAAAGFFLATIERDEIYRATGVIEPYRVSSEHIKAPISGTLRQLAAGEGETIARGERLAVIWPDELDVVRDVETRQLNYEIALEEVRKTSENIATWEVQAARLERELALVRDDRSAVEALERRLAAAAREYHQRTSDAQRTAALFSAGVISASEHEQVTTRQAVAAEAVGNLEAEKRSLENTRAIRQEQLEREVELARRRILVEEIDLAQREKELAQQESMLEAARQRSAQMNIYAPWSGTVVRQEKSAGDRVISGETIVVLTAHRGLQVAVRLRPEHVRQLAVGQEALIVPRSDPRLRVAGQVGAIGSYARGESGGDGNYFPAWINISRPPTVELLLGTTADVTIMTGRRYRFIDRWRNGHDDD